MYVCVAGGGAGSEFRLQWVEIPSMLRDQRQASRARAWAAASRGAWPQAGPRPEQPASPPAGGEPAATHRNDSGAEPRLRAGRYYPRGAADRTGGARRVGLRTFLSEKSLFPVGSHMDFKQRVSL